MSRPREVRVRVPASSANLGSGFDTLGLALGRYDQVEVAVAAEDVVVEVSGEGKGKVPRDGQNLVVRAMRAGFETFGHTPPGLRLRCTNAIPHARGLGSSAAAAVAGVLAAAAMAGRDPAAEWRTLLQLTAGMEGHADNAAACLLGGFVIAWESDGNNRGQFDAIRLDVHPDVQPVVMIATQESSTELTRALLPAAVPLVDAAFTGSRTALAVHAFSRRPELLLQATEDRLHQTYRRPAYPASADLIDALRAVGIPAMISGAGPTVLALPNGGAVPADLVGEGFTICPLAVDQSGARVITGAPNGG